MMKNFNFLINRLSSTGLKFTLLIIAQFGSIWEGNTFAFHKGRQAAPRPGAQPVQQPPHRGGN